MTSTFIPTGQATEDSTISNNGFFPDFELSLFRAQMRVDQTASDDRAAFTLKNAMIDVNRELAAWQAQHIETGHSSLGDVPGVAYFDSGKTDLQHYYQFAVFNRAKSELIERYRDYDSTLSGHQRSDELEPRIDDHLRECREAIRALLGKPRCTVELI